MDIGTRQATQGGAGGESDGTKDNEVGEAELDSLNEFIRRRGARFEVTLTCGCSQTGRNLVVCIDGEHKEAGAEYTNVYELHKLISEEAVKVAYFSGIGTYDHSFSRSLKKEVCRPIEWLFAPNSKKIVCEAYHWLSKVYRPGDRIFLFGFSRGAFQVRVLSAMIEKVGLITERNKEIISYAYDLYIDKRTSERNSKPVSMAGRFKDGFSYQDVKVHFVGAWDTVSSIGTVRPPGTTDGMGHVCYFRHALALDERRVKFLPEYACEGRTVSTRKNDQANVPHTKEVWFSGTHSDIGKLGEAHSSPPFRWMVSEAKFAGLQFKHDLPPKEHIHVSESLKGIYQAMEYLPIKRATQTRREGEEKFHTWKPHYGRGRKIHQGQKIHASLLSMAQPCYVPAARPYNGVSWEELRKQLRNEVRSLPNIDGRLEIDIDDYARVLVTSNFDKPPDDITIESMRDVALTSTGRRAIYDVLSDLMQSVQKLVKEIVNDDPSVQLCWPNEIRELSASNETDHQVAEDLMRFIDPRKNDPLRDMLKRGSLAHLSWENFHALLIGIDDYPPEMHALGGAVRDVNDMKNFLVNAFSVPEGFTLDIRELQNKEATRANIIAGICKLKDNNKVKKNDPILIYYAGHGATMPPPEGWPGYSDTPPTSAGWPEDAGIQCIVACDAVVSNENQKYHVSGVVLDRTLAALLHDLADAKGNNITVILDCCYSGSSTRDPGTNDIVRGIEFKDPDGREITVPGDYEKEIWSKFFGRGAVTDYKYRYSGLGSHVLLAACSSKERAKDGYSFTQALLEYLKNASLDALSYAVLIKNIGPEKRLLQNPICEGDNKNCMLFDVKEVNLGRLTFDVVKENGNLTLCAGEILGIIPGTEFAVHTSKLFSIREAFLGNFVVENVGATTSSLKCTPVELKREHNAAIGSPTTHSQSKFFVHVADESILPYATIAAAEESPEDQWGRPQLSIDGATDEADLILAPDGDKITFQHRTSSEVGRLGLQRLILTSPKDPSRIRHVLRAAAHFFKYLRHEPQMSPNLLRSQINVYLHELEETDNWEIGPAGLRHAMKPVCRLEPGESGAFAVKAAKAEAGIATAPPYGIEIVNKHNAELFTWVFFFDCSTLEIRQFYEPRAAKGQAMIDPTLPRNEPGSKPLPVALNFRNGSGQLLRMQLYEQQSLDVGFLRIFLLTRYLGGGLSSIAQTAPLMYERGTWRGKDRERRLRGTPPGEKQKDSEIPDLWDVITIPLVQRAE